MYTRWRYTFQKHDQTWILGLFLQRCPILDCWWFIWDSLHHFWSNLDLDLRFVAISDRMLTIQVQSCMHDRRLTPDLGRGGRYMIIRHLVGFFLWSLIRSELGNENMWSVGNGQSAPGDCYNQTIMQHDYLIITSQQSEMDHQQKSTW